jgi:macrodomain Ter protein organizer (MatP/YcbG family)
MGFSPEQQRRNPRRVSITLSFHVHDVLLNRSQEEGRSLSNLCAYLIEEILLEKEMLLEKRQQERRNNP